MITYLGIDLHKRVSSWVLIDEKRKVQYKRTVMVTPEAIASALNELPTPLETMRTVVEPVCGWRWVVKQLEEAGTEVRVANPLRTRLIADSRMKYDSIDAQTLAELLRANFLPTSYMAPPDIQLLRALIRERTYLVQTRTGLKNRLKAVVAARGFHEIRDNCLQKGMRETLLRMEDRELTNLVQLIQRMEEHITPLDREIALFAKTDTRAQLLMTIPVIGPITATTIIAEVGDVTRFKKAKQMASYAGLVPSQRSSAGKTKHGRITKVGSKYLRTAFVESAMRFRPAHDRALYDFYERVRKVSSPMKGRVALARKLATITWYMLQRNEPFRTLPSEDITKCGDSERRSDL